MLSQRRGRLSLSLLALLESVDAALGIDDPLLAAEEGMADRADLGLQFLERGAGDEGVAAEAVDHCVVVIGGMNLRFHGQPIVPTRSNCECIQSRAPARAGAPGRETRSPTWPG